MGSIMNYMPFLSEGVNAGTGLLGTLITNKANKRMADTAFQRNIQMWNMQNAYNSPASQMARFKQAGLNPNLIYGQGNAGNATSAPRYDAPRLDYQLPRTNVGETLGQYMDLKLKGAQVANVTEQNRSIKLANDINAIKLRILEKFGMKKEEWMTNKAFYDYSKSSWDSERSSLNFSLLQDTYDSKVSQAQSQAKLTDQQYLNALLDNSIRGLIFKEKFKNVEFLENGGKYISPFLQFMQMLTK